MTQIPKLLLDLCANTSNEQPAKLKPADTYERIPLQIRMQDCDTNGHVNNSVYLSYIELGLPQGFADAHTLKSVCVNFKDGMPYGGAYFLGTSLKKLDGATAVRQICEGTSVGAYLESVWEIK